MPDAASLTQHLLELQQAGTLAAQYPRLGTLLAEADETELARAGRLLSRLDPEAVLAAHPTAPALTVAVTGSGTVAPVVPALAAEAARHGIVLRTALSSYDSWLFDLTDPTSELYAARPDLVLCVLDPTSVLAELPTPWTTDDLRHTLDSRLALVEKAADQFTAQCEGTLVLNTLPLLRTLTGQLVDLRSRAHAGTLWREANIRLLRIAESHPAVVVIDTDPLVAEVPAQDPRLSAYAKAHLSPEFLAGYAREAGHLARHLAGRTKKVLALDLDGTVWGGILGDDGSDGISIGEGPAGEAFAAFQRIVRQIGSQGVLLAAVSKNDPEPVDDVLHNRHGMQLRPDDFVRVTANWQPKHLNLTDLTDALNLGVDSVVFVDDSPYECGLVRRELPGVAVVPLDDEPALHIEKLLRDGWFDTRELTAEDRKRSLRYRDELVRKDFQHTFDSIQDYLDELGVTVALDPARDSDVPRLSQITLRTNQFNLTTRRRQPADVQALLDDPEALVLAVRSADRFGDNGVVGAVFARREGRALVIDNFLLSCRVFARGIEQTCLSALLRHAAATGADTVYGSYLPSPKNGKVAEFYPRHGFTAADTVPGLDERLFRHDLGDIPPIPAHVHLDTPLEGLTP
ncbi:HAD-IIIC family phosphatase [Streptomyces sp. NPDC001890]|uniref:HAD-IIIC family phosphatase n=1 Tax=Streptomyces sp. NPDC001890 TaxID=3364620 RepID=UPI0036BCCBD9